MKIALLTGGTSAEREVSLRSAANVAEAAKAFAEVETFTLPESRNDFVARIHEFDVAIPVIHGVGGEDGSIQGLLESFNVPYVFSGIQAHAIAIDKHRTKEIVASAGITSSPEISTSPCFVKPRFGGSSVASKLCTTAQELTQLQSEHPDIEFVHEAPVRGREFTVGVLEEGSQTIALPVVEIIPKGAFFDFESKYDPEKLASEICPANIDAALAEKLSALALAAHRHIGCRDISRTDFIVPEGGEPIFLEINTIPGMTGTSLVPKMLKETGRTLEGVLQDWISRAIKRTPRT